MLSSNGSGDTCISLGVSTFLHAAFTAHDLRKEGGQRVVPANDRREAWVLCGEVIATHTDLHGCRMVDGAGGDQRRVCLLWSALRAHLGWQVLDVLRRFLGLRCRMDQQSRIVAQDLHPALEVGRAVGDGGVVDAA